MADYHFKLQTVLRLRITERDSRLAELAKAHRAEEILREQQAKLSGEIAASQAATRQMSEPGQANIDGLLQLHRYELVLKIQGQQLSAQLVQVQAESERRRLAVVEADRQVRVLEKLRERQRMQHQVTLAKRETKQLDEVAVVAYARGEEDER